MTCLPVVGLVPKFGQKLNALGRELGLWEETSGEEDAVPPRVWNWVFCCLSFVWRL